MEVTARRVADGKDHTYVADAVLVTVPVGVLRAPGFGRGAIRFEPELPGKAAALEKIEMGQVVKVAVMCRERFWERLGRFCFAIDPRAEIPVWWTQETKDGEVGIMGPSNVLVGRAAQRPRRCAASRWRSCHGA